MWSFETEPEFQKKLDWVEQFCKEEVEPLHYVFPYAVRSPDPKVRELVKGLQQQVKDQGLWAIFLDEELGGPGFGQLKLGLLNEILGKYPAAPQLFGAAAPDTGNMEMLAAYGTEEQKERWLTPLLNQEMFSAYSMTEPQGGSDPNLFRTTAVRDGEEWVINGEKWFTSAGRVADILFVMCTNGMFVVPRTTPGVEIMPEPRNHNHIIYKDVRVPLDHLLGPEDGAKVLAQRRLGGGRIHHAMRTIAQCKLAFDMMCERALSRESHGKIIGEHQMVQEKIAESYAKLRMLRLYVLETAVEHGSHVESGDAYRHRRGEVHDGAGAPRGVVRRFAHPRLARHHQSHAAAGHVCGRSDDGARRWRRRGAQVDRRASCAEGVPPARGLLPPRVHPVQARGGLGGLPAEVRRRSRVEGSRRALPQVLLQPFLNTVCVTVSVGRATRSVTQTRWWSADEAGELREHAWATRAGIPRGQPTTQFA